MGLLANSMANPEAGFRLAGVDFSDAQPQRQGTWLSFALVAALHVAGLYAIATWTPRSEWVKLWKPVEVQLIQEEALKPPEVMSIEAPPPPQKPQVVERRPVPPPSQPKVEDKPVVPEQPAPVMAAAPNAPAVAEAPSFVVPPQPEAPPPPLPAPTVQAAAPAVPRTVAKVEFIRAPDPAYPMMSRRLGEQGKVMIRALVDEQGRAIDVAIQHSSGKPRLDEAAKKAVMSALFKPYREDGKPEQVYVVVPVVFKMET